MFFQIHEILEDIRQTECSTVVSPSDLINNSLFTISYRQFYEHNKETDLINRLKLFLTVSPENTYMFPFPDSPPQEGYNVYAVYDENIYLDLYLTTFLNVFKNKTKAVKEIEALKKNEKIIYLYLVHLNKEELSFTVHFCKTH